LCRDVIFFALPEPGRRKGSPRWVAGRMDRDDLRMDGTRGLAAITTGQDKGSFKGKACESSPHLSVFGFWVSVLGFRFSGRFIRHLGYSFGNGTYRLVWAGLGPSLLGC